MTTDQLTPSRQRHRPGCSSGPHPGSWGLGMATPAAGVDAGPPRRPRLHGFGWDGGTGTTWRSGRRAGHHRGLFTQRAMTSPEPPEVFAAISSGAYASISDEPQPWPR